MKFKNKLLILSITALAFGAPFTAKTYVEATPKSTNNNSTTKTTNKGNEQKTNSYINKDAYDETPSTLFHYADEKTKKELIFLYNDLSTKIKTMKEEIETFENLVKEKKYDEESKTKLIALLKNLNNSIYKIIEEISEKYKKMPNEGNDYFKLDEIKNEESKLGEEENKEFIIEVLKQCYADQQKEKEEHKKELEEELKKLKELKKLEEESKELKESKKLEENLKKLKEKIKGLDELKGLKELKRISC